jgi:hypothetical protein
VGYFSRPRRAKAKTDDTADSVELTIKRYELMGVRCVRCEELTALSPSNSMLSNPVLGTDIFYCNARSCKNTVVEPASTGLYCFLTLIGKKNLKSGSTAKQKKKNDTEYEKDEHRETY